MACIPCFGKECRSEEMEFVSWVLLLMCWLNFGPWDMALLRKCRSRHLQSMFRLSLRESSMELDLI